MSTPQNRAGDPYRFESRESQDGTGGPWRMILGHHLTSVKESHYRRGGCGIHQTLLLSTAKADLQGSEGRACRACLRQNALFSDQSVFGEYKQIAIRSE